VSLFKFLRAEFHRRRAENAENAKRESQEIAKIGLSRVTCRKSVITYFDVNPFCWAKRGRRGEGRGGGEA
jgi:hypothetical protein